ncbi:MAG: TrmH family RNA methyltransferase [Candidatus Kryptoniota bacterium]
MLSNAEIRELSDLKERTVRQEQCRFLIEGKRSIAEALAAEADIRTIIVNLSRNSSKFSDILGIAAERGIRIEEVPETKFRRLVSTETSQGIIAVATMRKFTRGNLYSQIRAKRNSVILILDRVSDPGNLGTILRSAEWFGVDAVLITQGSVDVYNPKVVRSAMAAIEGLNILEGAAVQDEIPALKDHGFAIVASSQIGKMTYFEYAFPPKLCLIFGSEAAGIDKRIFDLCDESVMIPRIGKMESLNVGVAFSIVIAELIRQRSAPRGISV